MTLNQVIEALLFASQKPLTPKEIVSALRSAGEYSENEAVGLLAKTREPAVGAALLELRTQYAEQGHSFQLAEQAGGWQLVTDPEFSIWVRMLFPETKPTRLSAPGLETLAIIAYRQPITKADVEAVRGVAVDGVMQTLLDRGLVKIAGRADVPGRPLLYETTQHFLEHFGLKAVDELPNASELRRVELPKAEPPVAPVAPDEAPKTPILPGLVPEVAPAEEVPGDPTVETPELESSNPSNP